MNRLHRKAGEEHAEPVPFQQYPKMAPLLPQVIPGGIGTRPNLLQLFSFTADSDLL